MMDLIAQIDSADSHYFKKELLEFQYTVRPRNNAALISAILK